MKKEELLRRYIAGERDFSGIKLICTRLIDIQVPNIILKNTDLRDAYSNSHSHEVQYFFSLTFNLLPNTTKVYLTNPRNAIYRIV